MSRNAAGWAVQPGPIAQYCTLLSVDDAAFAHTGDGTGPSLLDRTLTGKVVGTSPHGCEVQEGLEAFAFPFGIKLTAASGFSVGDTTYHAFVLTNSDGGKSYGHCFTRFFTMKDDQRKGVIRLQIGALLMLSDMTPEESDRLMHKAQEALEPMCICVVSKNPLFQTLRGILEAFVFGIPPTERFTQAHLDQLNEIVQADVSRVWLSSSVASPPLVIYDTVVMPRPAAPHEWEIVDADWTCGNCSMRVKGSRNEASVVRCSLCGLCSRCTEVVQAVSFDPEESRQTAQLRRYVQSHLERPCTNALPAFDIDYSVLFTKLSPRNLATAFNAILCEASVLVLSDDVGTLTDAMVAMVSLLYPLDWPSIFIPILPASMSVGDMLEAPIPFVVGTSSIALPHGYRMPNHLVVVNLRDNSVTVGPDAPVLQLPSRLEKGLLHKLHEHCNLFKAANPDAKEEEFVVHHAPTEFDGADGRPRAAQDVRHEPGSPVKQTADMIAALQSKTSWLTRQKLAMKDGMAAIWESTNIARGHKAATTSLRTLNNLYSSDEEEENTGGVQAATHWWLPRSRLLSEVLGQQGPMALRRSASSAMGAGLYVESDRLLDRGSSILSPTGAGIARNDQWTCDSHASAFGSIPRARAAFLSVLVSLLKPYRPYVVIRGAPAPVLSHRASDPGPQWGATTTIPESPQTSAPGTASNSPLLEHTESDASGVSDQMSPSLLNASPPLLSTTSSMSTSSSMSINAADAPTGRNGRSVSLTLQSPASPTSASTTRAAHQRRLRGAEHHLERLQMFLNRVDPESTDKPEVLWLRHGPDVWRVLELRYPGKTYDFTQDLIVSPSAQGESSRGLGVPPSGGRIAADDESKEDLESFRRQQFINEQASGENRQFLQQLVSSMVFTVFVQDRLRFLGAGSVGGDMFDQRCFQSMKHKAWRYSLYVNRSHSGVLEKAQRGTTHNRWVRRYFELRDRQLSYFGEPSVLNTLAEAKRQAEALLHSVPAEDPQRPKLESQIAVMDGKLQSAKSSKFRRSFELIPSTTQLTIPDPTNKSWKTPFVFQLTNPDNDVLTLCAESAEERLEWILFIKSRLRDRSYLNAMKRLYLDPAPPMLVTVADTRAEQGKRIFDFVRHTLHSPAVTGSSRATGGSSSGSGHA